MLRKETNADDWIVFLKCLRLIDSSIPGIKGFNRRGLYRMKQFYEIYRFDEFVTPLVSQIKCWNDIVRFKR